MRMRRRAETSVGLVALSNPGAPRRLPRRRARTLGSIAEPPKKEGSSDRREHDQHPQKSVNPIMPGMRLIRQRIDRLFAHFLMRVPE